MNGLYFFVVIASIVVYAAATVAGFTICSYDTRDQCLGASDRVLQIKSRGKNIMKGRRSKVDWSHGSNGSLCIGLSGDCLSNKGTHLILHNDTQRAVQFNITDTGMIVTPDGLCMTVMKCNAESNNGYCSQDSYQVETRTGQFRRGSYVKLRRCAKSSETIGFQSFGVDLPCRDGCTPELLNNDVCDPICNVPSCFADYGKCLNITVTPSTERSPSAAPTLVPTSAPTHAPTLAPAAPTAAPTASPSSEYERWTRLPTTSPTAQPQRIEYEATYVPTFASGDGGPSPYTRAPSTAAAVTRVPTTGPTTGGTALSPPNLIIVIAVCATFGGLILICILVFVCCQRRKYRRRTLVPNGAANGGGGGIGSSGGSGGDDGTDLLVG